MRSRSSVSARFSCPSRVISASFCRRCSLAVRMAVSAADIFCLFSPRVRSISAACSSFRSIVACAAAMAAFSSRRRASASPLRPLSVSSAASCRPTSFSHVRRCICASDRLAVSFSRCSVRPLAVWPSACSSAAWAASCFFRFGAGIVGLGAGGGIAGDLLLELVKLLRAAFGRRLPFGHSGVEPFELKACAQAGGGRVDALAFGPGQLRGKVVHLGPRGPGPPFRRRRGALPAF